MRILNLKREFEYADKLFEVVNKLRLIGEQMSDSRVVDSRVVEKLLVTLPERFEAKISALEESKDLSTITLAELPPSVKKNSLFSLPYICINLCM